MFYTGVVENRSDPLQLGRCQVRIVGLHTHDKIQLPTEQLPWSVPIQPVNSAAMNGIGLTPVGPVEGTTVIIMFADDNQQMPIMLGTVGGIPQSPQPIDDDDSQNAVGDIRTKDIVLRTVPGPTTGKQLTFYDPETGKPDGGEALRGNFAKIGHIYDAKNDVFYDNQPYPSWVLNQETWTWEAPVALPTEHDAWHYAAFSFFSEAINDFLHIGQ